MNLQWEYPPFACWHENVQRGNGNVEHRSGGEAGRSVVKLRAVVFTPGKFVTQEVVDLRSLSSSSSLPRCHGDGHHGDVTVKQLGRKTSWPDCGSARRSQHGHAMFMGSSPVPWSGDHAMVWRNGWTRNQEVPAWVPDYFQNLRRPVPRLQGQHAPKEIIPQPPSTQPPAMQLSPRVRITAGNGWNSSAGQSRHADSLRQAAQECPDASSDTELLDYSQVLWQRDQSSNGSHIVSSTASIEMTVKLWLSPVIAAVHSGRLMLLCAAPPSVLLQNFRADVNLAVWPSGYALLRGYVVHHQIKCVCVGMRSDLVPTYFAADAGTEMPFTSVLTKAGGIPPEMVSGLCGRHPAELCSRQAAGPAKISK
ncbi:hypothetical protein Bbelb_244450 [Branchiostoma belcheri]|nr:hypothetical protein Bbelb_244450 [Branchiostoma belcheri]